MAIDEQTIQDQIDALQAQTPITMPTMARGSPADGTRPGWLGLLGEALGGGQVPGYRLRGQQEDAAGSRALLNFGINMLLASGPARVRPDLLSAAATGLQGAQQSIGADQQQAQAQAAADYKEKLDQAKFGLSQDHSKIERLKAMIPLLQLQQQIHQLNQPLPPALGGPPTGGPQAAADLPNDKAAALKAIAQRESGGNPTLLNYVAVQDPTAYDRGATASGKYQIVNSTWKEGAQLAGVDTSKYPTARAAPETVQDQVASVLWDKYGNKPWQKGAKDWVKDERGQYQLATIRPPAGTPGAPAPAPAPTAAAPRQPLPPPTADVAPTGVQVSGPAGVATPGPVAPPSPAVAGDVGAIIAGMTGAGADAATLAPGAGGAAPGVDVAQAGPPAAQPPVAPSPAEEFDVYRKQNLRGGPDLTELERAKAIAQWRVKQAATLPERDKASADVAAADVAIGQRKAAWEKDETERLFKVWDADRTAARTLRDEIEKEARAQQRAIELKTMEIKAQADETRRTNADSSRLEIAKKQMDAINTESLAAKDRIDDLDGLQILSENAGGATNLASTAVGGKSMLDRMVAIGAGTKEQLAQYGQMQQFQAGLAAVIKSLRQGMSLGSASDADLRYIESMGPSLMQDKQTRSEVISYIRDMQYRKMQFGAEVDRLMTDQPGMTIGRAIREAREGMPDVIPKVPQEVFGMPLADKQQWFRDHVRPKQLIRLPDGRVAVSPFGG